MSVNPWQVDTIQAFWFLKCPECTFDSKEEEIFLGHAAENHPLSYVFLDTYVLLDKTQKIDPKMVENDILNSIKTEETQEKPFEIGLTFKDNASDQEYDINEDFDETY